MRQSTSTIPVVDSVERPALQLGRNHADETGSTRVASRRTP
jgi:hypothetical protein